MSEPESRYPITKPAEIVAYLREQYRNCDSVGCRECDTYENAANLIERLAQMLRDTIPFMHFDAGSMSARGWTASELRDRARELTNQFSSDPSSTQERQ